MGERRALVIATSQYEDGVLRQLVAPAHDAEALAKVLQDPAVAGFDVRVVLNEPSYKVSQELETFFDNRKRDDLLFLYFSCHGIKDEDGKLYFATSNTHHKMLRSTAIRATDVNEIMLKSRSRRQVLVLDCCNSGAFARGLVAKGTANIGTRENLEGHGRVVLTASDSMQYSFEGENVEGEGVRSIFTRALVHGLETGEADLDGDGLISLDELYSYVHDRVTAETPQQNPTKWALDVEGEIIIARNPHPEVVKPAKLPDDLAESIDDRRPWVRMGALQELNRLLQGQHKRLVLAASEALSKLKNDDSREVSIAAEKCLATFAETERLRLANGSDQNAQWSESEIVSDLQNAEGENLVVATAELEPASSEKEEKERQATIHADQSRLAYQTAESRRLPAEAFGDEQGTRQNREERGTLKEPAERAADQNSEERLLASLEHRWGQKSERKIWVPVVLVLVSIVGAIWFFAHHPLSPVNDPAKSDSPTRSDSTSAEQPATQQSDAADANPRAESPANGPARSESQARLDSISVEQPAKQQSENAGASLRAASPRPERRQGEPGANRQTVRESSGVLQGSAITRVEPAYPPIAASTHITGVVIVEILVDEEGSVISARCVSGHPLLAAAALTAARGWKFRPTTLRGVPVKVTGTLSFNFRLGD